MNDSGYDSPKLSGKAVTEEKVVFYIDFKRKGAMKDAVWAEKGEILADAIKRKDENINIKNILIWAKLSIHEGTVFVNPFLLSCGFIRSKTDVVWEEISDTIYDYDVGKSYGEVHTQRHPFFISNFNQKNKENITYVSRQKLARFSSICVVAVGDENIKEALIRDGRFKNIERFQLYAKFEYGVGPAIAMNDSPADVASCDLEVKLERSSKPSTYTEPKATYLDENNLASTSGVTSRDDVSTSKENVFKTPKGTKRKVGFATLAPQLWGKNRLYDLEDEDEFKLTFQEKRERMRECLKARAWCTLLGPGDRATSKFHKSLEKRGKIEFSNQNVLSRPVSFSKTICNLNVYDSIGFLKCGDVLATCFLVSPDLIATNWHVVDDIKTSRRSSTPTDHSEVFVNFGYEQGEENVQDRYRLAPLDHEENIISNDLDYAFLRVNDSIEGKTSLGTLVRTDVPCLGKVCIVGHPNGREKQEEICPIIPRNDGRISLRYEDGQAETDEVAFYTFRNDVKSGLYDAGTALPYDVGSMFEGSSGAPVFNMRCEIVALHTLGFYIGNSMAIEAGVTFAAITRDLCAKGREKFVKEHFPYCTSEEADMETD